MNRSSVMKEFEECMEYVIRTYNESRRERWVNVVEPFVTIFYKHHIEVMNELAVRFPKSCSWFGSGSKRQIISKWV